MADTPLRWKKIGLIAGDGDLPVSLARHCIASGIALHVSRIDGISDPRLAQFEGSSHGIAAFGERIKAMKAAGVDTIVFAGNVKRPDWGDLKPDIRGALAIPRLIAEGRKGDDALLTAIMNEFVRDGFAVVGAEEILDSLLARSGVLGAISPSPQEWADIAKAAEIAAEIGRLDIGQAVAVAAGLVLAVEAQEGTDSMLARVASLPVAIRGVPGARLGVLLKCPKPQQERRIDLPTIGLATLEGAARAGLAGIAVEADGALVMDRAALIAAADEAGMFVVAYTPQDLEQAPVSG